MFQVLQCQILQMVYNINLPLLSCTLDKFLVSMTFKVINYYHKVFRRLATGLVLRTPDIRYIKKESYKIFHCLRFVQLHFMKRNDSVGNCSSVCFVSSQLRYCEMPTAHNKCTLISLSCHFLCNFCKWNFVRLVGRYYLII